MLLNAAPLREKAFAQASILMIAAIAIALLLILAASRKWPADDFLWHHIARSQTFRIVCIFLAAVLIILGPLVLLGMIQL